LVHSAQDGFIDVILLTVASYCRDDWLDEIIVVQVLPYPQSCLISI
jgi:hypothetical protein